MQKLVRKLFSRAFLISISIIIQILTLVIIIWRFSNYFLFIDVIFTLVSILVVIKILNGSSNPAYKIAWLIPILTFPVFGGLFYLLVGGNTRKNSLKMKLEAITEKMKESLSQDKNVIDELYSKSTVSANQTKYIERYSLCPVYDNTATEYLTPGEKFFEHLIEELKKAERYIFVEFFIIDQGIMWNTILDILKEKAQQGLDVRVIYDDFGCLFNLPFGYNKTLEEMGIKCCVFNPFKPILSFKHNNRDHRKIVVIDGHTAYTGGINIADEYINAKERFGHWKDSSIFIKGEAVWSLTVMFLSMWNYLRATDKNYDNFRPLNYSLGDYKPDGYVQPFNDSPIDNEPVSENVYLNLINQAERYIYIQTPYLIADDKMMSAFRMAAKRGVDVKIITPYIPDKWYVHAVTRSSYEDLLWSGVAIYEYLPGFIHGKTFVVDDKYAVVGTINVDYRSLYLHFECGVWMYDTKSVMQVKEDTINIIKVCKKVTLEETLKVKWYRKLGRSILKIFAPLM